MDTNTVFTSKTENTFTDIIDHLVKNFEFDNHSITYASDIPDEKMKTNSKEKYLKAKIILKSRKKRKVLYPSIGGGDTSWENLITTVLMINLLLPV